MPKINPDLVARLQKKLGIGQSAVYARIKKIGQQRCVARRDLAALLLAWENDITIHKYATPEQLDRLDGLTNSSDALQIAAAPTPAPRTTSRRQRAKKAKKGKGNSVFVVHGRDEGLRQAMFEFLRALGLNPMEWEHAVAAAKGGNPYVGHIIETAMEKVQAVVVLFSPDEVAHLKEQFWSGDDRTGDGKPDGQPRPNVLFEAGLALGAHPEKTVLVQVGRMRPFSDIAGKHLVRLTNDAAKRNELANRLESFGCLISRVGHDWMSTGDFTPKPPTKRRPRQSTTGARARSWKRD